MVLVREMRKKKTFSYFLELSCFSLKSTKNVLFSSSLSHSSSSPCFSPPAFAVGYIFKMKFCLSCFHMTSLFCILCSHLYVYYSAKDLFGNKVRIVWHIKSLNLPWSQCFSGRQLNGKDLIWGLAEKDLKVSETFLLYTDHPCQMRRVQAAKVDILGATSVASNIRKIRSVPICKSGSAKQFHVFWLIVSPLYTQCSTFSWMINHRQIVLHYRCMNV